MAESKGPSLSEGQVEGHQGLKLLSKSGDLISLMVMTPGSPPPTAELSGVWSPFPRGCTLPEGSRSTLDSRSQD